MASTKLVTPTQKRPIPGKKETADSSSVPEIFTPVYDDSNWSEVICSKADQVAKLVAARRMNEHYKRKIERLKQDIENLNKQGESTLVLLEERKDGLNSNNEYLESIVQSNPPIEHMEQQLIILHNIQEKFTLKITDDKPFHDLGILKENDDITKLPKRLAQLLNQVAKQKMAPFMNSYSGVSLVDSKSMNETLLKRRYRVLKQTTEGSIRKAISERDGIKNEIDELRERINALKMSHSVRKNPSDHH